MARRSLPRRRTERSTRSASATSSISLDSRTGTLDCSRRFRSPRAEDCSSALRHTTFGTTRTWAALAAELQSSALGDRKRLEQSKVPVLESRLMDEVADALRV